jgi:hypothetical protein
MRTIDKMIFATLVSLATIGATGDVALAGDTGAAVKVVELTAQREGVFYARFSGNICDDGGAAKDIGQVLLGDPEITVEGIRELFSVLQAAKLSGSKVVVVTDGFTWGCRIKWVTLK